MGSANVDRVMFSAPVVAKLNGKHRLTIDDIEWVVVHPDRAGWHDSPKHGVRLLIRGTTEFGRTVRVTLYPTDVAGVFWCGTAWVE